MRKEVSLSLLALGLMLSAGCVTVQEKKAAQDNPGGDSSSSSRSKPAKQAAPQPVIASMSSLPVQLRCTETKWRGREWNEPIGYAAGDCDNYGQPTGMAAVAVDPNPYGGTKYSNKSPFVVEGLFVDGKPVPETQYTVRAEYADRDESFQLTCANLWYQPGELLVGKEDGECQFAYSDVKKYGLSKNRTTFRQRISGKFVGPMSVSPKEWKVALGAAQGQLNVEGHLPGNLFDPLARDGNHAHVRGSSALPISTLSFQGKGGILTRSTMRGAWTGDINMVIAGQTLSAKQVSLNFGGMYDPHVGLRLCGEMDNPNLTLFDASGRSLALQLTKTSGCNVTGFAIQNGARLEATSSNIEMPGFDRQLRSLAYVDAGPGPAEFTFGPLQLVPVWGTVTWPDGRVYDGRFDNNAPSRNGK